MIDSDVDSWYDWRRSDDVGEIHRRNVRVTGTDSLQNFTVPNDRKTCSRSNGMIRHSGDRLASKSGTEVRFINPAIYAETVNNGEEEEQDVEIHVKVRSTDDGKVLVNCGDSAKINDMVSTLSIDNDLATSFVDHAGDQCVAQETYRCYSFDVPSTSEATSCDIVRSKSVTSCRPLNRVERRCKIADDPDNNEDLCSAGQIGSSEVQRYTYNGHRVVQMSSSSLSSIRGSEYRLNESELAKKITYTEWMRKKQEMARQRKEVEDEVEKKKRMEAERQAREKEEREDRERENFVKWSEMKKREEEKKKAMVEKELELQKQLKEIEDKATVVKMLYLRQWERKKKEEEKVRQKKEEKKQKQQEEERKKRTEESSKAYENWRKMAKNKPRPATQGLLPHQKAKPAYVNPTPWQRIVDDAENAEEDGSNVDKRTAQPKINSRRSRTFCQ